MFVFFVLVIWPVLGVIRVLVFCFVFCLVFFQFFVFVLLRVFLFWWLCVL